MLAAKRQAEAMRSAADHLDMISHILKPQPHPAVSPSDTAVKDTALCAGAWKSAGECWEPPSDRQRPCAAQQTIIGEHGKQEFRGTSQHAPSY